MLTADNVDLNGIIDFEDYVFDTTASIDRTLIVRTMAPFLYIFYGIYNAVGCYFISSPIYDHEPNAAGLLNSFSCAIKSDNIHLKRPTYDDFYKFLDLDVYLGSMPCATLYNLYDDFKLTEFPKGIGYHIYPCSDHYYDLDNTRIDPDSYNDCTLYLSCDYYNFDKHLDTILKLKQSNVLHTLILNHPDELRLHNKNLSTTLHLWARALYDANVNNAHFAHSTRVISDKITEVPILGICPAQSIIECDKCSDIPLQLRAVQDLGCSHTLIRDIEFTSFSMHPVNPLTSMDSGLVKFGDLREDSIYNYNGNMHMPYFINWQLVDHFDECGFKVKLPPSEIDEDDDIEHTYTTAYYIKQPVKEHIQDDLDLFNLNHAGSVAPTKLLMAFEHVSFLCRDTILTSNGLPNTPTTIFDVNIARKNKSSGIPYNRAGPIGFMIQLFGLYRQALINHRKHSLDQSITLVINKVAINTKYRDRTILAINATLSEQGRCCFRFMLEKIKASAKRGGPFLIGFSPQHLGWHHFYEYLDDTFMCSVCVQRGGKDFPKYDRHVTAFLLYLSCHYFFTFVDPYQLYELADDALVDVFHLFFSEATQVIYNHLVALGSIYIKPGGQTSGGSRTADGNTMVHITLDTVAILEQLSYVGERNSSLLRDMRDNITEHLWLIPSDYMKTNFMFNDWKNAIPVQEFPLKPACLDTFYQEHGINLTIRHAVASSVYLSDDGIMNHDTRLIDYRDILRDFLLLSNYTFTHDKFHINSINEGMAEFLSQDTFVYYGYYFPLPNCERIYAALFISNNPNTQNPEVDAARTVALYGILYPYVYTTGHDRVKCFIRVLAQFINKNYSNIDHDILNSLDIGVFFEEDINVKQLNTKLDALYGFDIARAHPKPAREIPAVVECAVDAERAMVSLLCVVCEQDAAVTCIKCGLSFCNDGTTHAHVLLHADTLKHYTYQTGRVVIRCKCGVNDMRELYYERNSFYCKTHKPVKCNVFYDGVMHFSCSAVAIRLDNIEALKLFFKVFHIRDWVNCIRFAMDLFYHGVDRPYYYLIHYITGVTDAALRKEREIVVVNSIQHKGAEMWDAIVPASTRFDDRATYLSSDDKNNAVIRPSVVYNDSTGQFVWSFASTVQPKQIIRIPFNILATALLSLNSRVPPMIRCLSARSSSVNLKVSTNKPIYYNVSDHYMDMLPATSTKVLQMINRYMFSIVQGPPGSGKTYTAAWLLAILYICNPEIRILILGPSHKAVDVIFLQTIHILKSLRQELRNIVRVHHAIETITSHYHHLYTSVAMPQHRLVFCTLQSQAVGSELYDLVLTDEFSQQSDLYIMIYMQRVKAGGSVIAFGDHEQLVNVDEYRHGVKYSNLICYTSVLASREPENFQHFYMMINHYRSHPDICKIVSLYSYDDKLQCLTDLDKLQCCTLNTPPTNLHAFKCKLEGAAEQYGQGIVYNQSEIDVCKHLLLAYFNNTCRNGRVAILCAYKSQYNRLRSELKEYCDKYNINDVHVHTIDSVQGDEYDHVILALTRLNTFTLNHNRLNVAVSRAKTTLCILEPHSTSFTLPSPFSELPELQCNIIMPEAETFKNVTSLLADAINLRECNLEDYFTTDFNPSPLHADYVYFDCEFMNVKRTIRSNFALLIAFSLANQNHSHVSYGSPLAYREHDMQSIPLDINQLAHGNPRHWCLQYVHDLHEQQYALINSAKKQRSLCDINMVLRFCLQYCISKPIFVTWSGLLDLYFLIPLIKPGLANAMCAHKGCRSRAFYYSAITELCYCQCHARKNRDIITHFTKVHFYNMISKHRDLCIVLDKHDIIYKYKESTTLSKPALKLSEAHSLLTTCKRRHGTLHEPDVDVQLTRCVFEECIMPLLCNFDLNLQPAFYTAEISQLRHSVIDHHIKPVIESHRVCECGGGNRPRKGVVHNVDPYANVLLNSKRGVTLVCDDMNSHECDCDVSLYCDSAYYLTRNVVKPSYIFYDSNPEHYVIGIDGYYYYTHGRNRLYRSSFICAFDGENVFQRLGDCDGPQRCVVLPHPVVPCNSNSGYTYNICREHHAKFQLIYDTAVLVRYGYKFVYIQPPIVTEGITDFSKQQLNLPGYETRQQQRGRRTTNKGQQLTRLLHSYLYNYPSVPINFQYICFGAAGSNLDTPLAHQFINYFKHAHKNFIMRLVDPRFENDATGPNRRIYRRTIAEYAELYGDWTFLIICDAYDIVNRHTWFCELQSYTDKYLVKRGIVFLKITHSFVRFHGYDIINAYVSRFAVVNVVSLQLSGVTSELWILCYDYDCLKQLDHDVGTRINNIWQQMSDGVYVQPNIPSENLAISVCMLPWKTKPVAKVIP